MNKIILADGRERSLLRMHPWVFSGAVKRIEGNPKSGETVEVISSRGMFLARGSFSPSSQIRVRVWSFDQNEIIDEAFFKKRIEKTISARENIETDKLTNSYRIISAEADGLPGIIVDRYGNFLVCQFLSAGAEYWKDAIVGILKEQQNVTVIDERYDVEVRKKEGLQPTKGLLHGEEPPNLVEIYEYDIKFLVDVKNGHKTGFYLDQRINRNLVKVHSSNAEVLNCFAYTGGFGLAALKGGAKNVINVEDVSGLLNLIDMNMELNQFEKDMYTNINADVFKLLRQFIQEKRSFDLIILDPPKFADSQRNLMKASRGYKDINLLAFKLLRPGGLLFTFSCSGLIKPDLFQKIVSDAAIDAKRDVQILQWLSQSADHPVKSHIPESLYLKGLLCRTAE